jgi:hypothetical protein
MFPERKIKTLALLFAWVVEIGENCKYPEVNSGTLNSFPHGMNTFMKRNCEIF